jgi:uncharacterized repeat protein (TIGR01451 family)
VHHSNIAVQPQAKPLRILLVLTQLIAIGSATVGALAPVAAENATATQISGVVFRDFNNNGIMDVSGAVGAAVDSGVADVEVLAFASGAKQSTARTVTDGTGAYTLSGLLAGARYRIEFGRLPAGTYPAPHGDPGATLFSGTSVQFSTAGATQVNLGVNAPCDYCQPDPWVVMPVQRNGQPVAGTILGSYAGMYAFPYSATRTTTQQTTLAYLSSIGSVWGSAYLRGTRTLLAAAMAKRHAGFGPLGIGGIYAIDVKDARAPALGSVRTFAKLSDLGVDVGVTPRAAADLPVNAGVPNRDSAMFDAVGKIGIGGIDAALDGRTVWVVNLKQRTLVRLAVDGANVTLAGTVHMPESVMCARGVLRPFAVKAHLNHVYVGAVCSAENGGAAAQLTGYVFRHDPAGVIGNMSTVLSFPLNYARGAAIDRTSISASWNPWIDAWQDIPDPTRGPDNAYTIWPQPILSSIAFDIDGSMVIGMMDRLANQGGNVNYSPVAGDKGLYSTVSAGDVLRACLVNGAYVLENNGECGGVRSSAGSNTQGPGGAEFYHADDYFESHDEVAIGSLALLPGARDVGVAAINPDDSQSEGTVFQQGMRWLSHTSGGRTRAFQLIGIGGYNNISVFGKAAGLGDAELLCDPAPIEIGNRVWFDANGDGIQDADEDPLPGVSVLLTLPDGGAYTAVTSAQGEYFFSNASFNSLPHARYDIPLRGGVPFTLSVNPAQPAIAGYALTTPDADGLTSNDAVGDVRDSDAITRAGEYEITGVAGEAGENNHSYDIGLRPVIEPPLPLTPTPTPTPGPTPTPFTAGLGDYVWLDSDQDGTQDSTEEPIGGITVTLLVTRTRVARDGGGIQPAAAIVGQRLTDARGFYEFRGLESGVPYLVCFSIPSGLAWTLPETNVDGALGSDADILTSCTHEVTLGPNEFNPNIDAGLIPAVAIQKTGATSNADGTVGDNNLITYTVKVWNLTAYRINGVVVTDSLPSSLRYVPGSAVPAPLSEAPLSWMFPTLRPSETVTISFLTEVIDINAPAIRNLAYLSQFTKPVTVDSSTVVRDPTLIQLERFGASTITGGVRLNWRTIAEANTLGFHLYRSTSSSRAAATRITGAMILGANTKGADYAFDDTGPQAVPSAYYWLEETELSGRTIDYGPVTMATASQGVVQTDTSVVVLVPPAPVPDAPVSVDTNTSQTRAPEQSVTSGQTIVLATATPVSAQKGSSSPTEHVSPEPVSAPTLQTEASPMPSLQAALTPPPNVSVSQNLAPEHEAARSLSTPDSAPVLAYEAPRPAQDVAVVIQGSSGNNVTVGTRPTAGGTQAQRLSQLRPRTLFGSLVMLWLMLSAIVVVAGIKLGRLRK